MRTLLATHLVPYPPDSGGKAVSYQTLRCLSRLGPVDICAHEAPWAPRGGATQLRADGHAVTTFPLRRRSPVSWPLFAARGLPYYICRDYASRMQAHLSTHSRREYDLVFADSLQMAAYVSPLPIPKVLQQHNAESYLVGAFLRRHGNPAVRLAGRWETRMLETFERDQCNAFDTVIVLSEVDRARLQRLGVRVPIAVVPPGVDPTDPVPESPEQRHVVHVGTGHWPPVAEGLRWYVERVHPLVRRQRPEVDLLLAGAPPRNARALGQADGVRLLGYVEDLEPVYRAAAVFIVPLLVGGGVRIKILHALARGLAVVTTSAGCEGLGLEPGRHLLVGDDPDAFAAAVVAVTRDPHLRRALGQQARAFVLDRFRPEQRCAGLEAILRAVSMGQASC